MRGWDNLPAANTTARLTEAAATGGAQLMLLNGDISYARGCVCDASVGGAGVMACAVRGPARVRALSALPRTRSSQLRRHLGVLL